jgi:hypothetical protein
MTIREAIHDESVSYSDFRCFLNESGCGDWDQVNSTDNVRNYCCDMIKQGIAVSHIVAALEQHDLYHELIAQRLRDTQVMEGILNGTNTLYKKYMNDETFIDGVKRRLEIEYKLLEDLYEMEEYD